MVSLKANRPIHFGAGIDRKSVPLHADAAANFPGQRKMFPENKDVAPQSSLQVQVLHKYCQAPAHFRSGFQVHYFIEGQNVFRHRSANSQRVCECADISVHLPVTCNCCANPKTSPFTWPFTLASCPNRNTSPSTVPSMRTRSPNRKMSPLIVSSAATPTDSPLRVSYATADAGCSSIAAQNPASTTANAEPRRTRLRKNATAKPPSVSSASTSNKVIIDCHPFQ